MTTKDLALSGSARGLPVLLVAHGAVMMHFVFSRAFRDSLLGSHLNIQSLPSLTVWSTVIAAAVSLLVSSLLRSERRAQIVRRLYAVNAVIEVLFSLGYRRLTWLYSVYYIEVGASTAIGLSMMWILIGDWASSCHADRSELIPKVLVYGTATTLLAGIGLTRLREATSFGDATLMLAAMNAVAAAALLFYSNDYCLSRQRSVMQDVLQSAVQLSNSWVRKFALLTVVGATASTLLDLMFRIRVAEHYVHQSDRLHFLGIFQSLLSVCTLLCQMTMSRVVHKQTKLTFFHLHPGLLCLASCTVIFAPGFWPFTFLRGGEYSLRNSVYRLGSEMAYAHFPDEKRGAIRPVIDVIGERLGDFCASGILAFLLFVNPRLPVRLGLFLLAVCSLLFWWVWRGLEQNLIPVGATSRLEPATTQSRTYSEVAHEGAGIF